MNEKDIQDLIKGCLRQEAQSQRQLYRHFYAYAMTIASRYTSRLHDTEEIVNDAFVKVFTRLETYNDAYRFKSWLSRIVINAAINHFQKYYRNEMPLDSLDNVQEVSETTEAHILGNLTQEELLQLIQALPPAYRMVFNLFAIEGYKHDEIAKMLNIAEKTSQSNLVRARQKLQRMIATLESVKR